MNYFWNETLQSYFETLPLSDVEAYKKKVLKENEWKIVEVSRRPCFCHDWIDGAWVLDVEKRRAVDSEEQRGLRNQKLETEVDPIAGNSLRWADLSDVKRAEWAQYRIDLLNVPQQESFPTSIQWPTKPD